MKPILFNTEMVRAILDGRKTQTRRVVKIPLDFSGRVVGETSNPDNPLGFMHPCGIARPRYQISDILYVRETWRKGEIRDGNNEIIFKADIEAELDCMHTWKPSIHMPREAARLFLCVTSVRVERLQDITEDKAKAEGAHRCYEQLHPTDGNVIYYADDGNGYYTTGFKLIWDTTIKPAYLQKHGWNANPWVWVYEFERVALQQEE